MGRKRAFSPPLITSFAMFIGTAKPMPSASDAWRCLCRSPGPWRSKAVRAVARFMDHRSDQVLIITSSPSGPASATGLGAYHPEVTVLWNLKPKGLPGYCNIPYVHPVGVPSSRGSGGISPYSAKSARDLPQHLRASAGRFQTIRLSPRFAYNVVVCKYIPVGLHYNPDPTPLSSMG